MMRHFFSEAQVLEMLLDIHWHKQSPLAVCRRYKVTLEDLNFCWLLFGKQINVVHRIWVLKKSNVEMRQKIHDLRQLVGAFSKPSNN